MRLEMRCIRLMMAVLSVGLSLNVALAEEGTVRIDASREVHRISPWLTGACIEDVNHEIYGGIYSQMIFGESFQEPAIALPVVEMKGYGGEWHVKEGVITSRAGEGNKIVSDTLDMTDGEVSVQVRFDDRQGGNAGLVTRTTQAGVGADAFFGYEIALDPSRQIVRLGRHRNNYQLLGDTKCVVPEGEWIDLTVRHKGSTIEILVNGKSIVSFDDAGSEHLTHGTAGLRQFHRAVSYRNLKVTTSQGVREISFAHPAGEKQAVSRMWLATQNGTAKGSYSLVSSKPFVGLRSQRIEFVEGSGTVGITNLSLNRWGMHFEAGKEYEGVVYARAEKPTQIRVVAETRDGAMVVDSKELTVSSGEWGPLAFSFTPSKTIRDGRFTISLDQVGAVDVGYVSLQPGEWGRYRGLPVRKDIVEMLKNQGVTVMRYGGSMINNREYRWKKMIGPRALRPPYIGHWYEYSTNGWGIVDFLNLCEAMEVEGIPTFSMSESPEDVADFVSYAKGDANSEWGMKRVADGHQGAYPLHYMQLGNEERVDVEYANRFEAMGKAIWAVDPSLTLIVGDFVYNQPIKDPNQFRGSASGITNLDGQKKILEFAKKEKKEIWFDVHVWTDGPVPDSSFDSFFSFIDALESISEGAPFKVMTFEFNANNHSQKRAIANALAINRIERDGRIPLACSANCLQPDGQNDNGWDQGLVFFSPSNVWMQAPGYVTKMYAESYQPRLVSSEVEGAKQLDFNAKLSQDGKSLTCSVVNLSAEPTRIKLDVKGFVPAQASAKVVQLTAPLEARNTEDNPQIATPKWIEWKHGLADGESSFTFAPYSVTTIVLE